MHPHRLRLLRRGVRVVLGRRVERTVSLRFCGAEHAPGCHHSRYYQQGLEQGRKEGAQYLLGHARTLDALTLALSQDRPIHPEDHARRILLYLAKVSEQLDGIDCGTPVTENVELPEPGDLVGLVDFLERDAYQAVRKREQGVTL
jgi:hypothetical protein